jgi:hypothetical protein
MTEKGVTFPAWHGTSYVSAPEVLNALDPHLHEFVWQVRADEVAPGPGARQLQEISPSTRLSTPELLDQLRPGAQIIDGELRGYESADSITPAVTLRAVDSTWWDVESEDDGLIAAVRDAFPDASWIDDDARGS